MITKPAQLENDYIHWLWSSWMNKDKEDDSN
jgi:hypothetical protein